MSADSIPEQSTPGTWAEFRGDLRASLRAWRVAPLLPVISPALLATSALPESWWAIPAVLFVLGWFGTERIWYLRIYGNERIEVGELLRLTRAFFGRFLRLALLVAIVWVPVIFWGFGVTLTDPNGTEGSLSGRAELAFAVVSMVTDFVLTFVTPALAFSTKRVRAAFRLGIHMLRDHWPRTAWYALVPPLTIFLLGRVFTPSTVAGQMATVAGITLLVVWFKGATAAFYLRRVEVGRDGAAFVDPLEVAT